MQMETGQTNLGYLLNKASLSLRRRLSGRLEAHGVTAAQWGVLRDLACREELPPERRETSPAQIAARLEQDRPTLSGILERLRVKGLVTSDSNPQDKRSQLIGLTEKARSLLPILEREADLVLEQALAGLDGEASDLLQQALQRLIANLNEPEAGQ